MGKWSTQRRSGSARRLGSLSAPAAADFVQGTTTSSSIQMTRVGAFPAGADRVAFLSQTLAGVPTLGSPATVTTSATFSSLASATSYSFRMAWASSTGGYLSDWSPAQIFVTA